jgi:ParB/RepB/Spo0J family partition protein
MESITRIPLEQLRESSFNYRKRFSEAGLAELAADIKEVGVQQPLLVRPQWSNQLRVGIEAPDRYEIVFGARRFRASQLAGVADAPCMVRSMTEHEARRLQISENLQREDVHPIEEAEGFQALMNDPDEPISADGLAEQLGKSRSYVYGRLKLLQACPKVRQACLEGKIGSEVALLIARLRTDKLQQKALGYIEGKYLDLEDGGAKSYRRIRELLNERFTLKLKEAMFDTADALLLPDAGACNDCPKRSGNAPEYEDVATFKRDAHAHYDYMKHHGADVCTDPDCFEAKKKAHLKNKAAELEGKGKTVIDGAKARAAIDASGQVKGGYIALKDVKAELKKAAAAVDTVTIQDPRTGKTVEAVKVDAVKAAGVKVKEAKPTNSASHWQAQQKKHEEERRRAAAKAEAERKVRSAMLVKVREAVARSERSAFDMGLIARVAIDGVGWEDRIVLAQLWGCKDHVALAKKVGSMSAADLTLLMVDCALVDGVQVQAHSLNQKPEGLLAAAEHYGVDLQVVRDEVSGAASTPSMAARAAEGAATAADGSKAAPAKKAKAAPAKAKGSTAAKAKKQTDDRPAAEDQTDEAGSAGDAHERDPNTSDMFEEV